MLSLPHDLHTIKQLLNTPGQNILVVTHRNPDGDAMGSSCALSTFLRKMGHHVFLVTPNSYPSNLNWLPEIKKSLNYEWTSAKCKKIFKKCDILFAVDFNDLSRIREFQQELKPKYTYAALIDHHPNPGDFADLTISDTSVSSASELTYLFIREINKELIDKEIAESIYVGIMTDTGCFSFNSSKKETFAVVSELLNIGIDKDKVYGLIYDNYSSDRMRLMGKVLTDNMVYLPEHHAAYITLLKSDMEKYNFKVGDSEGFVNMPLSIKGVHFSAMFTERDDIVKVSLRSKGDFDVNEIAMKYFSGGGHRNASGGESKQNLKETTELFESILPKYKKKLIEL